MYQIKINQCHKCYLFNHSYNCLQLYEPHPICLKQSLHTEALQQNKNVCLLNIQTNAIDSKLLICYWKYLAWTLASNPILIRSDYSVHHVWHLNDTSCNSINKPKNMDINPKPTALSTMWCTHRHSVLCSVK
jgi:hypothetical protein